MELCLKRYRSSSVGVIEECIVEGGQREAQQLIVAIDRGCFPIVGVVLRRLLERTHYIGEGVVVGTREALD